MINGRSGSGSIPVSSSGHSGRTTCLVAVIALPGRSAQSNRGHVSLKTLSPFHLGLFEVSASWLNRRISAHGRPLDAVPADEFQHWDKNQADDAQYIGPGGEIESQEHDDHIGLFPGVLCQERQSSRAEEEEEDTRLQHTVHPRLGLHTITTLHVGHRPAHEATMTAALCICLFWSTPQSATLPHALHRETHRHPAI